MVRDVTAWFIIVAPFLILYVDYVILVSVGVDATITGVTRSWSRVSNWPEFVYVSFTLLLYLHLFRGWF